MAGLLAFHAHPDDESLFMGGTLAKYAAAGEEVVVVTATRGEEGEIHNYDDPESMRDSLADYRSAEVAAALQVLGVTRHHFLDYRDSGMMGTEANHHTQAFWNADFTQAGARLVRLVRRYRPEVMTVYDPFGAYGHPDHIQVHRIGTAAFFGAPDVGRFPADEGQEPWQPSKLYWATLPRSAIRRIQAMQAARGGEPTGEADLVEPSAGVIDDDITVWIDTAPWAAQKREAVMAHRTQIPADSWVRTLDDEGWGRFGAREPYVLAFSRVDGEEGHDLFAGLR